MTNLIEKVKIFKNESKKRRLLMTGTEGASSAAG